MVCVCTCGCACVGECVVCVCRLRVNVKGPSSISVTRVTAQECKARGNIKPVLSVNAFVSRVCASFRCHGVEWGSLG